MRAELAAWQQAKAEREPRSWAVDKASGPRYVGCFKQGLLVSVGQDTLDNDMS